MKMLLAGQVVAMCAIVGAGAASADSMKSMQIASELGNLLSAEQPCGLTFDQTAVSAFIEKNVEADDMSFPGTLRLMTEGAKYKLQEMSKSEMTAYCTQATRLSKAFGFTSK